MGEEERTGQVREGGTSELDWRTRDVQPVDRSQEESLEAAGRNAMSKVPGD